MSRINVVLIGLLLIIIVAIFFVVTNVHAWNSCSYNCYHPSPSPSASASASPSATPSAEPSESPRPSVTPASTPEVTPTPNNPEHSQNDFPNRICQTIEFTPTITGFNRVSPTSVRFIWSETAPIDDYRVFYGLSQDNLMWNVGVENTHEVTLNDLPTSTAIFAQVKGTDGVCLGNGSQIVDP